MKTKLTLRMDQDIIEQAKAYAKSREVTLSGLVEDFFRAIASDAGPHEIEDSPLVRSLFGLTEDVEIDDEDYRTYLEEKHR